MPCEVSSLQHLTLRAVALSTLIKSFSHFGATGLAPCALEKMRLCMALLTEVNEQVYLDSEVFFSSERWNARREGASEKPEKTSGSARQ